MPADSSERIRLSVADARELSERALRGMGFADSPRDKENEGYTVISWATQQI